MKGFIEELKYRNVFRVGIAYIVAGWLIAQVADLAADAFNAPEWFMQMLIILLLLGLPVALFLAWAFELTPEGLKRADELPEDMPKDPRSGKFLNRATIIGLVAAVAWLGWDELHDATSASTTEPVADKSIAVLPFDDFSPDGDQAWFADGLSEEILNSLARIADLHVASRTSTFAYRGSDLSVTDIAGELGVAHILEGSVRRAGNQLRVTAQLIRAADDKHLWSETFDGDVENSIVIQEEIATKIANALQTAMDPVELERMISAGTASVEAYELYLRAKGLKNEGFLRLDTSRTFEVVALHDQAIAIDPDFVDAHAEVRDTLYSQLDNTTVRYTNVGPPYAERRARFDAALEASIRLARTEVERLDAQTIKANIEVRLDEQLRISERLVELEPDSLGYLRQAAFIYRFAGLEEQSKQMIGRYWDAFEDDDVEFRRAFIYEARRLMPQETVARTEKYLSMSAAGEISLSPIFYYQAHRAFLEVGDTERAAEMIDPYNLGSGDADGRQMIQIRQACAEGRDDDAHALYDAQPRTDNNRWLALRTLGRDDEARELLRQYENPEKLFILAGYLQYRTFDPREYPLLWSHIQAQGFDWAPVRRQTFRCKGG